MFRIKQIGKYSYIDGHLSTPTYLNKNNGVYIGSFTSIAKNCTCVLGYGDHYYNVCTNYPFNSRFFKQNPPEKYRGVDSSQRDIHIGNDVWIGRNCTIMSGVTIGDGSVIAAYSHVVKDVEPYSIYGGNPAKFIKYRFDKEIIDKFIKLKWWDLPDSTIEKLIPILYSEPTHELLEQIVTTIKNDTPSPDNIRYQQIWSLYASILGRWPDDDGINYYENSNLSIDEIKNHLINSEEYKRNKANEA